MDKTMDDKLMYILNKLTLLVGENQDSIKANECVLKNFGYKYELQANVPFLPAFSHNNYPLLSTIIPGLRFSLTTSVFSGVTFLLKIFLSPAHSM